MSVTTLVDLRRQTEHYVQRESGQDDQVDGAKHEEHLVAKLALHRRRRFRDRKVYVRVRPCRELSS